MSKEYVILVDDTTATDLELYAKEQGITDLKYVQDAIRNYNSLNKRKAQIQQLQRNSIREKASSSEVIQEMQEQQDSHIIL